MKENVRCATADCLHNGGMWRMWTNPLEAQLGASKSFFSHPYLVPWGVGGVGVEMGGEQISP